MRPNLFHPCRDLCRRGIAREHHRLDAHRLEQRQTEPPLYEMLRLIVEIRLTAPADDEDAGDAVDLPMQQREQGVDDVAEAAVLQIDERHLARCDMIARRKCRRAALIHGDHMRVMVRSVRVH